MPFDDLPDRNVIEKVVHGFFRMLAAPGHWFRGMPKLPKLSYPTFHNCHSNSLLVSDCLLIDCGFGEQKRLSNRTGRITLGITRDIAGCRLSMSAILMTRCVGLRLTPSTKEIGEFCIEILLCFCGYVTVCVSVLKPHLE